MSYSQKALYEWNTEDVIDWIRSKGLSGYIEHFRNNEITGYDLCFITSEDLKNELNVVNIHQRLNLLKEIRKMLLTNCKNKLNNKINTF
jgi:hypothetical protein